MPAPTPRSRALAAASARSAARGACGGRRDDVRRGTGLISFRRSLARTSVASRVRCGASMNGPGRQRSAASAVVCCGRADRANSPPIHRPRGDGSIVRRGLASSRGSDAASAAAASRALSPASELKWKGPASSRSFRRARTSALSCASGSRPRWPRARAITSSAHALPPGGGGSTSATIGRRRGDGDGRHRGVAAVDAGADDASGGSSSATTDASAAAAAPSAATAPAPAPRRARAAAREEQVRSSCLGASRAARRRRRVAPLVLHALGQRGARRRVGAVLREQGVEDVGVFAHGAEFAHAR